MLDAKAASRPFDKGLQNILTELVGQISSETLGSRECWMRGSSFAQTLKHFSWPVIQ